MYRLVLLFIVLLFALSATSQPSKSFNFQSILLTDEDTPIINSPIELRSSLLNNAGESVYVETHRTETSEIGYFSIDIGRGAAVLGGFNDLDWGVDSYFLRIDLIESGVVEQLGDIELLSVPYALLAHFAEEVEFEGPMGPQGYQGAEGAKGAMGAIGPCGPVGAIGPKGAMGAMGATGEIGAQGKPGEMIMVKSAVEPSSPWKGQVYVDDGSNRLDGALGLRYFDGGKWLDI